MITQKDILEKFKITEWKYKRIIEKHNLGENLIIGKRKLKVFSEKDIEKIRIILDYENKASKGFYTIDQIAAIRNISYSSAASLVKNLESKERQIEGRTRQTYRLPKGDL